MKHSIVIKIMLCFILSGCESWLEEHLGRTYVEFRNNTDYMISVSSAIIPPNDSSTPIYPDTSLPFQQPRVIGINPFDDCVIMVTSGTMSELYTEFHTDTVSFFILSTEQLSSHGWDSIRTSYNILQRYDFSLDDFHSLKNYLTFPPTEKMRNIKMWPPYGTYDALGHRRE